MSNSERSGQAVNLHYPAASRLITSATGSKIALSLDDTRGTIGVRGHIREPALFRDAFMTAATIMRSDLRYKGRDRTAYLAYLMSKGKKATAAIWEAQKSFLDHAFAHEDKKISVLDPILTVHPDQVSLEVFSRDESAYARLAISNDAFDARAAAHGTTFVDLSDGFVDQIDRMRAYREIELDASSSPVPDAKAETRAIEVPYAWLRGFLQVQSAATLPAVSCEIEPVDLYNLLFVLRTRTAKKSPRGLRFELIGGSRPRLVVEPWNIVLECHGPVHHGPPLVIRTFGRQRLLALARILPYLRSARVQLLGPGLPVFWILDLGKVTLTTAFTGWTESSWASAASFDSLMPSARDASVRTLADSVGGILAAQGPMALPAIVAAASTKGETGKVREALQLECLRGRVLYDLSQNVYRPRDLLPKGIDDKEIRFGSPREAKAHRLLGDEAAGTGDVKLTKIHEIAGEGVEIHGEIVDKESHRTFMPRFMTDLEGRAKDAWCSCPTFRRSGMREGPCEHMIALRIEYGRKRAEEEALRQTPEGRKMIRAETRTYVRRERTGIETQYRVSLDDRVVYVEWGQEKRGAVGTDPRHQRIWFDTDHEARDAYFRRIEALVAEGYVDAATAIA